MFNVDIESDNTNNLVHADQLQQQQQQHSVDNKKDVKDHQDEDEDHHWKVPAFQQAVCPMPHTLPLNQVLLLSLC